jgi:predicted nucleic acid-binding Zn ribbon protein
MRRLAPRPATTALATVVEALAPATTLARVQGCWRDAVGPVVADEAEPVSERDGVVTVTCRSAVWAQELDLLAVDLLPRLNALIASSPGDQPVRGLRAVAGGLGRRRGRFQTD